jgi:hypothetical protein
MRKLAPSLLLAILFVPSLAAAQLSLGPRTGFAFPLGEVRDGEPLSDHFTGQIPFQIDVGYRITPALTIGGYVSVAPGVASREFKRACDAEGADCTMSGLRYGLQLDYRFIGVSPSPWIGAGIGWERVRLTREVVDGDSMEYQLKGTEFLNLQGGVEWKTGRLFSIGPFAMLSVGRYSRVSLDGETDEIEDETMHGWLQLGVRGRFDL